MLTTKTTTVNDQVVEAQSAAQIGEQAIKELNKLGKAVKKLYEAGEWKLPPKKMPGEEQAKLWENVRRALKLEKNNTVNAATKPARIPLAQRSSTSEAVITGIDG